MGRITVSVFNKLHFPLKVERYTFLPGEEVFVEVEATSMIFRNIRSVKGLRVGKSNNAEWKKKHLSSKRYEINMVYDANPSQRFRRNPYERVVESLANPMLKHLQKGVAGYTDKPVPGVNVRFFSSQRIRQHGKMPVGPYDVFYSHGIGDKDYWVADKIEDFNFAMVPGPAWKTRIEAGGYKGKVWVVGYTKLDPVFNGEYKRNEKTKPYVIWAPTHAYHRKYKGRSSYPQCMQLINEIPGDYETHVALHPSARLSQKAGQDVTMQELVDADVVIADAGSTLYEAWALGKPVIFPDWICKKDVVGKFGPGNLEHQVYAKGIGYHAKDMKQLVRMIDTALSKGMQQQEIEFMETVFPSELRGKAGQKSAEVLMEIRGGVGGSL